MSMLSATGNPVGVGLDIVSILGGLFSKKSKGDVYPLVDPAAGMSPSEMDPILKKLMSSSQYSANQRWGNTFNQLQDSYQARGLGGSGIEFANESQALRQNQSDVQAQQDSEALALYKAWIDRVNSERAWAVEQRNASIPINNGQQSGAGTFFQQLGQLGGYMGNGSGNFGGNGGTSGGGVGAGIAGTGLTKPASNAFSTGWNAMNNAIQKPGVYVGNQQTTNYTPTTNSGAASYSRSPAYKAVSQFWRG